MELIVQGYFYYTAMVSKVSIEGLLVLQNVKKKPVCGDDENYTIVIFTCSGTSETHHFLKM